jgi:hypothetical protein
VEPPRRAELERRIVTGERREFAAVHRLIEREQDDAERLAVAKAIKQRSQRLHVLGPLRNVRALVATECFEQPAIVIAKRARMNLHHQAIVDAHLGHLDQHGGAEQLGIRGGEFAAGHALEQTFRFRFVEIRGGRGRMAVIRRRCARLREVRATLAMRIQIALPVVDIFAGDLGETIQRTAKRFVIGIDHRIGSIGGDDATAPAAVTNGVMMIERIDRRLGGGQHFDVEALEQRTRPECILGQLLADDIVVMIGGRRLEAHLNAKHFREHIVHPQPRGRAVEQIKVRGEFAPCFARLGRRRSAP